MQHIVLDVKWVIAFCIYYALAVLWGISASINGIPAIAETGGGTAEVVWAALITVISAALIVLPWFNDPNNILDAVKVRRARFVSTIEQWTTLGWVAVVGLYPASVIFQFIVEGDPRRGAAVWAALILVVFPFARFIYLTLKNRKNPDYEEIRKKTDG